MNQVMRFSSSDHQDFIFKEDEKTVLKLRFNTQLSTARIETENKKRVFIIEDEGLVRTRLVLKNEYGVRIGYLVFDGWDERKGVVQIESTHFRFALTKNPSHELRIYSYTGKKLIYSCSLSFEPRYNFTLSGNHYQSDLKEYPPSFVLAVSWYVFQQLINPKESELSFS